MENIRTGGLTDIYKAMPPEESQWGMEEGKRGILC